MSNIFSKEKMIPFFRKEIMEIIDSCRDHGSDVFEVLADKLAENRWKNSSFSKPELHPRFEMERAEMRYLGRNKWHLLCGTRDNKFCCVPEDYEFKNPMSIDDAVIEQKKRDSK